MTRLIPKVFLLLSLVLSFPMLLFACVALTKQPKKKVVV
jgi:hypothetical protein